MRKRIGKEVWERGLRKRIEEEEAENVEGEVVGEGRVAMWREGDGRMWKREDGEKGLRNMAEKAD